VLAGLLAGFDGSELVTLRDLLRRWLDVVSPASPPGPPRRTPS
jgi:hypothetical protein